MADQGLITAYLAVVSDAINPIQTLLAILFGMQRSLGSICQTVQRLWKKARTYQLGLRLPLDALAEADEIFHGLQPCPTVVDIRSFNLQHGHLGKSTLPSEIDGR